jgi:TM2 domain-containing membrane protein YozV
MKNKTTAGLLALFLGGIGVHKFYLGKASGIWYLLFCWTFIPVIVAFIEAISLFTMSEEEFDEKYNKQSSHKTSNLNDYKELEKLHDLKNKGIISEEDYQEKRGQIISKVKKVEKELHWFQKHPVLYGILAFIVVSFMLQGIYRLYYSFASDGGQTENSPTLTKEKNSNS